MWKKVKVSDKIAFGDYYKSRNKVTGAKKRTNQLRRQREVVKKQCRRETKEDGHFWRARREHLIKTLLEQGKIHEKEAEEFRHFNQEPGGVKVYTADNVYWKGYRDFALDLDKFVVESFDSTWPLDRETYLSQQETVDYYNTNSLNSENLTLTDTVGIQRKRFILGLEEEN